MHFLHKLRSTLTIAVTLILARTFGTYLWSEHSYELSYALYEWRGEVWAFPTEPFREFGE